MRSPELYALLEELGNNRIDGLLRVSEHLLGRARHHPRSQERLTIDKICKVHRREAAALLFRAARTTQLADPYWKGLLHKHEKDDRVFQPMPLSDVRGEARELVSAPVHDRDARKSLEPLLSDQPSFSARSLAKASLALTETDSVWMLLCLEHMRRGEWGECHKALDRARQRPTSPLHEALTWELRGMTQIRAHDLTGAIDSYQRASRPEPSHRYPLACAFLLAAIVGDQQVMLRSGSALEESRDGEDRYIFSVIEAFQELDSRGTLAMKWANPSPIIVGTATDQLSHAFPQ